MVPGDRMDLELGAVRVFGRIRIESLWSTNANNFLARDLTHLIESFLTRAVVHTILYTTQKKGMAAATTSSSTEDEGRSPPPRKRIRVDSAVQGKNPTKEPRLFAPFRALGLVTNHVPFVLQTRSFKGATEGPRIHLLTCLGRAWAMWEGGKMGLLFVGE